MNKFIASLAVLLVVGSFVAAQTADDDDTCALYGGKCTSACPGGYDMNLLDDNKLCGTGRNSICCNQYKETCKSRGGECATSCPSSNPDLRWDDAQDCKALGRQCCIYV